MAALFGKRGKAEPSASALRKRAERRAVALRVALVVALLVACGVPVVFVNSAISYIPLVSAVLLVGLSYAYLRVLVRSLEYSEASLLPSCERGSDIEFVVRFKNNSPLVFLRLEPTFYIGDLFGDVDVSIPATMTLMPHEDRDFRFEASFEHLGTYSAGVSEIRVGDLLGLFYHTLRNPERHEVKVLPRLFDVSNMDLSNVSVQESRKAFQPIVTDDMDYAGVREYAPGDPLKTIHWKLSSRNPEGTYYTRLFETFGNPGVSIIIDTSSPAYDHESLMQVFDGLIESALSLNAYAQECGVDSEIVYTDKAGESKRVHMRSLEGATALVDDIPRINVDDGREGVELLQREAFSIHAQGNTAFCTAHLNDQIVTTLLEVKLHDRNPLLFVVVPSSLAGDERAEYLKPLRRLEAAQVVYYVVESAADISQGGAR